LCVRLYLFVEEKLQNGIQPLIEKDLHKMKKGIHPENYRLVAFKDMSNEDVFITKSTVETKETITHEGVEYPVLKWRFLELLTLFTQVNLNLLILQVVLINSNKRANIFAQIL
jgi:ribosomal protein L31